MRGTAKRPTEPRGDSSALAEMRERLRKLEVRVEGMAREIQARQDADDYRASLVAEAEAREKGWIPLDAIEAGTPLTMRRSSSA